MLALDVDSEEVYLDEIRRCLSKDRDHFRQRNEQKLRLGLGAS